MYQPKNWAHGLNTKHNKKLKELESNIQEKLKGKVKVKVGPRTWKYIDADKENN